MGQIAVGVTVFIAHDQSVLLGRKGPKPSMEQQVSTFVGKWVTPGGRVNYRETLFEAAIRETFEETRLAIEPMEHWFVREIINADGHYVIHVIKARLIPGSSTTVRAGDDLAEVRWFQSDRFPAPVWDTCTALTKEILQRGLMIGS